MHLGRLVYNTNHTACSVHVLDRRCVHCGRLGTPTNVVRVRAPPRRSLSRADARTSLTQEGVEALHEVFASSTAAFGDRKVGTRAFEPLSHR